MPAHSPFSSAERFGLSALASLQSIVVWVVLAFFVLMLGDETEFVRRGSIALVSCCLFLALFVGVISMLFVFRFVWKAMAPVVNEHIPTWEKLIISVLSSMSVGQVLWIMGMMGIGFILVMIRECLTDLVDLELVHYWEKDGMVFICAPICAGLSFVAMIWFGCKVYHRLSAAEFLLGGDVGRTSGEAIQTITGSAPVTPGDESVMKPKR